MSIDTTNNTLVPSSIFQTTNTLPSTLLTTPANLTVAANTSQSYQLLFTTVSKSHPRIKYSGLKKVDEKTPVLVEAGIMPTISANATNIIDISAIAPLMTTPLTPLTTTTITIPASTIPMPKGNAQVMSISSNDLSPAIKYADIDDIELPDGTKIGYPTDLTEIKRLQQQQQQLQQASDVSNDTSYTANLAEKYSILAASALKNFDFTINDSSMNQSNGSVDSITNNDSHSANETSRVVTDDGNEELFACRHCGKRYRWKSTLRRHENDECGNKEPAHQCPYCPYKAKQRGNLGVHVRKHHANLPQLESRRKRKN